MSDDFSGGSSDDLCGDPSDATPVVAPRAPDAPSVTAGPPDGAALWDAVEGLVRWLDQENALPPEQMRLLRILKLSEEAGEVAQAVIGAIGQNPRKGRSHTWDDVQSELCDVIVTAMVALRTLTPDARRVFEGHVERVVGRAGAS